MKKQISINTQKIIGTPDPKMWGIFFEEVNHAGEGGLYAEMIRNRAFADSNIPEGVQYYNGKITTPRGYTEDSDFSDALPSWTLLFPSDSFASMKKTVDNPRNPSCPEQLQLCVNGSARLTNSGFWGVSARKGGYHGSIIVRSEKISKIILGFCRKDGSVITSKTITGIKSDFRKYEYRLTVTGNADENARFFIDVCGNGTVYFDFVSLFPDSAEECFRRDLMEKLRELKPGFLRFPGGCVVEGFTLANAIHWKDTIGPVEDRHGHWDLWNYRSTDGLGMMEFCRLGELLGAELMYVCNCGMSCQPRKSELGTDDEIEFWKNNVLDAVEFMIGDESTEWGAKRASLGHPAPFNLRYVEIGNENWGEHYARRYNIIYKALREKYPQLTLIANSRFEGIETDMVDDHYYYSPREFQLLVGKYSERGEKIYIGEYATNREVGYGNLVAGVAEAVFMTDMENCCDRVRIASYAPLFCNNNDRKWPVNLINYDNNHIFCIPSYSVQKLFANNSVTHVVETSNRPSSENETEIYVTAGINGDELIIKAAVFGHESAEVEFVCDSFVSGNGTIITVASENDDDTNTLLYPDYVTDVASEIKVNGNVLKTVLHPMSFNVIRVKIK